MFFSFLIILRMPESENGTPNVSAPATPGTPGAPLFSSIRVDSLSYDRKSMPRCNKCFSVESLVSSPTCLIDFPRPDVSLTRKVHTHEHTHLHLLSCHTCRRVTTFAIFHLLGPLWIDHNMFTITPTANFFNCPFLSLIMTGILLWPVT